jgi:hypothetical protein
MKNSNCDLERDRSKKFTTSDLTRWDVTAWRSVCVCVLVEVTCLLAFDLPRYRLRGSPPAHTHPYKLPA